MMTLEEQKYFDEEKVKIVAELDIIKAQLNPNLEFCEYITLEDRKKELIAQIYAIEHLNEEDNYVF